MEAELNELVGGPEDGRTISTKARFDRLVVGNPDNGEVYAYRRRGDSNLYDFVDQGGSP